jgi:hypothetical protein
MGTSNLVDDCETQPGASGTRTWHTGAVEGLEDPLSFGFRNAVAMIFNDQLCMAGCSRLDSNTRRASGMSLRVVEQVPNQPAQQVRIATYSNLLSLGFAIEVRGFLCCQRKQVDRFRTFDCLESIQATGKQHFAYERI